MNLTDVTPNLIVADIDRSTAFYRDLLGFSIVTTVPDQAPHDFVWLQRGGVNVFLNAQRTVQQDAPHLAARPIGGTNTMFVTLESDTVESGVDALYAAVVPQAPLLAPLKDQFYGMREFAVEDPDGYVLIFAQRIG